jgi:hypothetical protein
MSVVALDLLELADLTGMVLVELVARMALTELLVLVEQAVLEAVAVAAAAVA